VGWEEEMDLKFWMEVDGLMRVVRSTEDSDVSARFMPLMGAMIMIVVGSFVLKC
jgi:hypothetical protein